MAGVAPGTEARPAQFLRDPRAARELGLTHRFSGALSCGSDSGARDGRALCKGAACTSRPSLGVFCPPCPMPDRVALKANRVMVVTDELGDILPDTEEHLGIYLDDTRFVSRFHLRFGNKQPVLLSYSAENAAVAIFQLVNATLRQEEGKDIIPRQSISIRRARFVTDGLHERLEIENCAPGARRVECALAFDADFRDLFDVRARKRRRLGVLEEPVVDGNEVLFEYQGADGVRRLTRFSFDPAPDVLERGRAVYRLDLAHGEITTITIDVVPGDDEKRRRKRSAFGRELERLQADEESW